MMRRPPRSTLFPYTPLSRSRRHAAELASRAPGDLRQSAEVGIEGRRTLGPRLEQHDPEGLDPGGNEDELRSEEHTSELQSQSNLVCRLLLEKKKPQPRAHSH